MGKITRSRKLRRPRIVASILAVLSFAAVAPAQAADMPSYIPGYDILRGPVGPAQVRWYGLYLGGAYGHSSMTTDFDEDSAFITLPQTTSTSSSYGGFLGYNFQWDDLVVGFEGGYSHMLNMETAASIGGSASSLTLLDYATFRARAGYSFGQFLPYAFIGGAVGRADYSVTVAGALVETKSNAYMGGFAAGLGLDVAVLPNVFIRGEWEYIAFSAIGDMRSSINTARVGVGIRF